MNNTSSGPWDKKKDKENFETYRHFAMAGFGFTIATFFGMGAAAAVLTQDISPGTLASICTAVSAVASFVFDFYLTPKALKQWRNYREEKWNAGKLRYSIHEAPSLAPLFCAANILGSTSFFLGGFGMIVSISDNIPKSETDAGVGALIGSGVSLVLMFVSMFYFRSKFFKDTKSFFERKRTSLLPSHNQNQSITSGTYGALGQRSGDSESSSSTLNPV